MAGKGSRPRPLSVDRETFNENYERIFGKSKRKERHERETALDRLEQLTQDIGMYDNNQCKSSGSRKS